MKVSEVIDYMEELKEEYGDLEVKIVQIGPDGLPHDTDIDHDNFCIDDYEDDGFNRIYIGD